MEIKNVTAKTADLYIYGAISSDGGWFEEDVTPNKIIDELAKLKGKTLNVYINSGGGDVFAGTAIHNALKRHYGKVIGHVDGMAASIASVILMACDEIVMPSNAYVMIHRPMVSAFNSNTDDLLHMAELLEKIEMGIVSTYLERSELTEQELKDAMEAETWYLGDEIKTLFKAKNVRMDKALKAVACASINDMGFKHPPKVSDKNDTKEKELAVALELY